jgi:nucleotide-binding universal stress UspA family protein
MRVILIATDGSDSARAAVDVGIELAESESAQAVFAHVASIVDLIPEWKEPDVSPTRLPRPEEEPALAEALELATEHGVEARAELLIGYPPRQIAGLADQIDADCIVVGSRELGRLKRARSWEAHHASCSRWRIDPY